MIACKKMRFLSLCILVGITSILHGMQQPEEERRQPERESSRSNSTSDFEHLSSGSNSNSDLPANPTDRRSDDEAGIFRVDSIGGDQTSTSDEDRQPSPPHIVTPRDNDNAWVILGQGSGSEGNSDRSSSSGSASESESDEEVPEDDAVTSSDASESENLEPRITSGNPKLMAFIAGSMIAVGFYIAYTIKKKPEEKLRHAFASTKGKVEKGIVQPLVASWKKISQEPVTKGDLLRFALMSASLYGIYKCAKAN